MRISDEGFIDPTSEIAIEVWVKMKEVQGGWQTITHKHGEARAWWLGFFLGSSTRIYWSNAGLTTWCLSFDIPSALNTWRHIVVTYKDGVGRRGYVDGELVAYDNASGNLPATTGDIFIAHGWDNFDGLIDEVEIYTRALTAAEIQQRYAEGAAKRGLVKK